MRLVGYMRAVATTGLLMLGAGTAAMAQTISQPTADSGISATSALGQSFTATLTGYVTAIGVKGSDINPRVTTLRLYNGAAGSGTPGSAGTPAYTQADVPVVGVPSGSTLFDQIPLTTPFPVIAGDTYTFTLANPVLRFRVADVYAGGTAVFNFAQVDSDYDFAFQIFETLGTAQTIAFINPGLQTLGTSPVLTGTASSGLTPVFSSATPAVCTVTSGGTLTLVGAGNCTINANQAGNATYAAAPQVSQTFAVAIAQTITFSNPGAQMMGATPTLSASSSSGLPPTFTTATPTVCTVTSGGTLALLGAGNCTINANQAGDATYAAAPQVSQTFAVAGATQSITFSNPGSQTMGAAPTVSASSSSGLPPIFTTATPAVCAVTAAGALSFIAPGSCTINADQAGNATFAAAPRVTQTFAVAALVPTSVPTLQTWALMALGLLLAAMARKRIANR